MGSDATLERKCSFLKKRNKKTFDNDPGRRNPRSHDMKAVLAACAAFLGGDMIWLFNTGGLYRHTLPPILAPHPVIWAGIAFYLVYLFGLTLFCVRPGLRDPWPCAVARGALFGFVAYATYDLTNQATIAGWPVSITCLDLLWGTFLSGFACLVGWFVGRFTDPERS